MHGAEERLKPASLEGADGSRSGAQLPLDFSQPRDSKPTQRISYCAHVIPLTSLNLTKSQLSHFLSRTLAVTCNFRGQCLILVINFGLLKIFKSCITIFILTTFAAEKC